MLSRIQSLGSGLIVLTLLLFAGSGAAQDVSSSCEAAIDRDAGTVRVRGADGFAEPRTVRILGRETLKCDEGQGTGGGEFEVLRISRPLEGPGQVPLHPCRHF